jgi:hypothetical protein
VATVINQLLNPGLPTREGDNTMSSTIRNQAKLAGIALAATAVLTIAPDVAFAQSGHFVTGGGNTPVCTDEGTIVMCTATVAGLGGTEFEITIDATGTAAVTCTNPGGNTAPGQDTTVETSGTTGEQTTDTNGNFQIDVSTDDPEPLPATPTCPNPSWTPDIDDVTFTTAVLNLFQEGVLVDTLTVMVTT